MKNIMYRLFEVLLFLSLNTITSTDEFNEDSWTNQLPNCIIIGVRKGGTRALLDFLSMHPEVVTANEEMQFFQNDSFFTDGFENGLRQYAERLPYAAPGQVLCEKTPAYFINVPRVPERIAAMSALLTATNSSSANNSPPRRKLKLILVLRDPVYRAISDYTQVLYNRKSQNRSQPPFEELAFNENGQVNMRYKAIRIGLYYNFLREWLRHFRLNDQLLVLDSETLVKNPLKTMRKLQDYLDLKPWFSADNFPFNATKGFHCKRTAANAEIHCLTQKGRTHPVLPKLVYSALARFYAPANRILFHMINSKFHWL